MYGQSWGQRECDDDVDGRQVPALGSQKIYLNQFHSL